MYAVSRAAADPAEDADHKFLNDLESKAAAPAQAANPAPATPAPVTRIKPASTAPAVVAQKAADPEKTPRRVQRRVTVERVQQPTEIAEADPAAVVPGQKIIVVQTIPDPDDRDQDQDHEHHHHFFHRLFSRLLGQHPEDW
jgi:hypothetical protein